MTDHKRSISSMFDAIAWRYDFLNHFLSFGTDRHWRRKAVRIIAAHKKNPLILDVATGTADLAIAAMKLEPQKISGIDISTGMLEIGREKIAKLGLDDRIDLMPGDSENIPFPDRTFDVCMVAFGVRNFTDPLKGLSEMGRVLKDGGMVMVLEFSKPERFPFRSVYKFYFRRVLPVLGRIFSGSKGAYTYLPESVMKFPDNENFMKLLRTAGFTDVTQRKLTGGVASIYTGFRKTIQ